MPTEGWIPRASLAFAQGIILPLSNGESLFTNGCEVVVLTNRSKYGEVSKIQTVLYLFDVHPMDLRNSIPLEMFEGSQASRNTIAQAYNHIQPHSLRHPVHVNTAYINPVFDDESELGDSELLENRSESVGSAYRARHVHSEDISEEDDRDSLDAISVFSETAAKERETRAKVRNRKRVHGTRQCWAKYCWADRTDPDAHSHPLETLGSNRLKMLKGFDADHLIRRGFSVRFMGQLDDYTKNFVRKVDFYGPVHQRIQGYFGSGIAGYVTLINRLLSLNFFIFLMVGGLYVVPSILNYHKYLFVVTTITNNSDSERIQLERRVFGSYANSSPYNVTLNDALYLPSHSSIKASAADSVGSTAVLDLLQGTGWLEASWLYLGQFTDRLEVLEYAPDLPRLTMDAVFDERFKSTRKEFRYVLPFAFLCAIGASMIVSLFVLIFSSGSSLKESIKGRYSRAYPFCEVVFGSWQHSLQILAGVENQKITETSQLKILCNGSERRPQKIRTRSEHFVVHLIRFGVWILVAALLSAFGYLLYMAISVWASPEVIKALETRKAPGSSSSSELLLEAEILFYNFLPSIIITGFNFLMPTMLGLLARFEDYATVKVEVRITLLRTVMLRFGSVALLAASLFNKLTLTTTPENTVLYAVDNRQNITEIPCFETYVGQQIYKILLLDIVIFIATLLFLHLPQMWAYRGTKLELLRLEFDLTGNILSAIYIQSLYWIGVYYAPLLSAVAILHFFLRAVLAQVGLFMIYETPLKIHHSTGSDVFFTAVALLAFFLSLGLLGFALVKVKPSTVCGPFLFNTKYSTTYDYFMGMLDKYSGNFSWIFPRYFTRAVILFPILVAIAVILYYRVATARAKERSVALLRKKVADATKQKKFLERKARQLKAM